MTTHDLREILIKEHKKDVRLTIISYGLILLLIVIIAGLIYRFAWNGFMSQVQGIKTFWEDGNNQIYHYIIPIALLTLLGYFIFNIVKLTSRMKKIDLFINKINDGKIASTINTNIIYKIILPLGKIKINLYPITLVQVSFDGEYKIFQLPIPKEELPNLRVLLSGLESSEINDINKAWYELYDGETTSTTELKSLKSIEEFENFVETELKSDIEEIESSRSKGYKKFLVFLIPTILIIVGWQLFNFGVIGKNIEFNFNTILIIMGTFFGVYYIGMYLYTQKKKKYLLEVQ